MAMSHTKPESSVAFFFLASSSVQDPNNDPFGGEGASVLQVLTNVYLALLFVILVCSLGNRPQGSRVAYIGCMVIFALLFVCPFSPSA